jgi:hypothetical protein
MANILNFKKGQEYNWTYENIGGSLRVKISSGEDIANLSDLDPKMWTVLSCPVNGLEVDEKSLKYIDQDGDGKIRIQDVVKTADWIVGVLSDPDLLLKEEGTFNLDNFDMENADAVKLHKSSKQILANLGKEGNTISLAETASTATIFANTKFNGDGIITPACTESEEEKAAINAIIATLEGVQDRSGVAGVNKDKVETFYQKLQDYVQWKEAEPSSTYGSNIARIAQLYGELDQSLRYWFIKPALLNCLPQVEMQHPDAQVSASTLAELIKLTGLCGKTEISEQKWDEIGAEVAAYNKWIGSKKGSEVEKLGLEAIKLFIEQNKKETILALIAEDLALKEEAENIESVDKFLHVYKDFYRLLKNFVTFHDFYDKDKETKAIFQSGKLLIDQRECLFCMKVADMAKHNAMAPASGMYLVYCDCTTKSQAAKLQIVAAVTVGSIGDLAVGKNAIYYDSTGLEWDAVITKIIDNPISISQAFWSPYRKIAKVIEDFVNKSAAEKDAKILKDATEKINTAPANIGKDPAAAAPAPFDIGKFAGIFAAFGMALGMIGTALSNIFNDFIVLKWWQMVILFISIMLIISGPSMVMAWMKLRRRNIAPLLNANGWAVNAPSIISILFGETLTEIARFPKLNIQDPYADKEMSKTKKVLITIVILVVLAALVFVLYYLCTNGFLQNLCSTPVE